MTTYLVGDLKREFRERHLMVIDAADADEARMIFARAEAEYATTTALELEEYDFVDWVYGRDLESAKGDFRQSIGLGWVDTAETKGKFNAVVREFFKDNPEFADRYITFIEDAAEDGWASEKFPLDMYAKFWLIWANVEVIPINELRELNPVLIPDPEEDV